MFLYVNHQPELYVFIRQPPTSICLPLRYSFVWALQGNSIYSQPFGMNSQMIFPRICCLVVTVIMDPVSSKAGKSWKNRKWSTKDSDIMGYISLGTHTYVYNIYIYIYIYAPVVAYITNTMICGIVWKWGAKKDANREAYCYQWIYHMLRQSHIQSCFLQSVKSHENSH